MVGVHSCYPVGSNLNPYLLQLYFRVGPEVDCYQLGDGARNPREGHQCRPPRYLGSWSVLSDIPLTSIYVRTRFDEVGTSWNCITVQTKSSLEPQLDHRSSVTQTYLCALPQGQVQKPQTGSERGLRVSQDRFKPYSNWAQKHFEPILNLSQPKLDNVFTIDIQVACRSEFRFEIVFDDSISRNIQDWSKAFSRSV